MKAPRSLRRPVLDDIGESPDYRFTLANERTFLAWIRTSLALLAAGVAVIQFVPSLGMPGGRLAVGILLIVLALIVSTTSLARWERVERAMRTGQPLPFSVVPGALAAGLSVVGLLALALILVEVVRS